MVKTLLSIGFCAALLLLTACTAVEQESGDLTGKVWALSELMGKPLLPGSSISAEFSSEGRVSGSSGCNRYSGMYTISGKTITFSIPMATTMMLCEQELMDQETAYLQALRDAENFTLSGDQLTLTGAGKSTLAVFQVQSQDLAGTSWEALSYNNGNQAVTGVLQGTILTANFSADGSVSGNAGCNDFSGSYKVNGSSISIGPLASTMKMCSDPTGVMDQEAQYLAALQSAATYRIETNVLELRTQDDALAASLSEKR